MEDEEGKGRAIRNMLDYLSGQSPPEEAERIRKQLIDASSQERQVLQSFQSLAKSAFRDEILEAAKLYPTGEKSGADSPTEGVISDPSIKPDWGQRVKENQPEKWRE